MYTLVAFFETYDKSRRVLTEAKLLAWELAGLCLMLSFHALQAFFHVFEKSDSSVLRCCLLISFCSVLFKFQEKKYYVMKNKILKLSVFYFFALLGVFFSFIFLIIIKIL
jgi:hypothetical protein